MKRLKTPSRPQCLVFVFSAACAACGPTEQQTPDAAEPTVPAAEDKLRSMSTVVDAHTLAVARGDRLPRFSFRRTRRTAAELQVRARELTTLVSGEPVVAGDGRWAEDAIDRRYKKSSAAPFPDHPKLVVDYFPLTDGLTVHNLREYPMEGVAFSRAEAHEKADQIVAQFAAAGLLDGQFVLGRTSSQVFSLRGGHPYVQNYIFEYFGVIGDHISLNRQVQLAIGENGRIDRAHIGLVEAEFVDDDEIAEIGVDESEALLRQGVLARANEISGSLQLNSMTAPIPAYVMDPWEDEAELLPRAITRYTYINPSNVVSRSHVGARGFFGDDTFERLTDEARPVMCREFAPLDRVAEVAGRVVVDRAYIASFVDPREPFDPCEGARLFEKNGLFAVFGIQGGGGLEALGLRDGDAEIEVCSTDSAADGYGQCFELGDAASLAGAFGGLVDSVNFDLRFERPGAGPISLSVVIADCPTVDGEVACSSL